MTAQHCGGVSYETDVDVALNLIPEILQANSRVLRDPAPAFGVARLAESSVTISVAPWVKVPDYDATVREVNKTILETFCSRNIVMALLQCESVCSTAAPEFRDALSLRRNSYTADPMREKS